VRAEVADLGRAEAELAGKSRNPSAEAATGILITPAFDETVADGT
jgi:hypothetical protein